MIISVGSYLKDYLEEYNITNKEFAERIGTTPKNLIDILNDKVELSMNMLINISVITGWDLNFLTDIVMQNKINKNINEYIKKNNTNIKELLKMFNYKKTSENYNISIKYEGDDYYILTDIMKYLRIVDLNNIDSENQTIFYKKKDNANAFMLALWLECCNRKCLEQDVKEYDSSKLSELVSFIEGEAFKRRFDEGKLINEFNKYGIYLVIQDDVKGTNVRGAFRVFLRNPAIYITRKYKRVADIYFVLLHELAHLKSDYNRGKKSPIVSLENEKGVSDYETKADKQALNWMVSDEIYNIVKDDLSLFNPKDKLSPFIVYRLAWDGIIKYNSKMYQDNNPVIVK